jgi:hypothetical protein
MIYKYFFGFIFFSFHILSDNNIGGKGGEEVSKSISSLAYCSLTNFSLNL